MKKTATGPLAVAAIAILCVGLVVYGWQFLAGSKPGQKPKLSPTLDRMYGPHHIVTDPTPARGESTPGQ